MHHRKTERLRIRRWIAFLIATLCLATLLPAISQSQSTESDTPSVDPSTGAVTISGFTLTPGNVDTSHWSERDKSVIVKFSLTRENQKEKFRELPVDDIEVKLNKDPVLLGEDYLLKNDQPIRVLFMIDRSGSMIAARNGGADKLRAATESLRYFVNSLGGSDEAEIHVFDLRKELIVGLTNDKRRLNDAIGTIKSLNGDTSLYGSIAYALNKAQNAGIGNIVFLSDGKEDTEEADRASEQGRLDLFKQQNEVSLSRTSRERNIPIYSIAIGEAGDYSDRGVDFQTLKNISASSGAYATPIDLRELDEQTGGDSRHLTPALTEKLKTVLAEIKKSLKFDYGIRMSLPGMKEGEGDLLVNITVDKPDQSGRITFPMVYHYSWYKSIGPPIFSRGKVLEPVFIDIRPTISWAHLTQIFLLLLSPLVVMGFLPSLLSRIQAGIEVSRISDAIELVAAGSPHMGQQCPNEVGPAGQRYVFKPGDRVLVCPKCHTAHHLSCWEYNGHECMNRVCEYHFVVPDRVLERYGVRVNARKQFA